ncbi:MAG: phage major capsid protein [Desulfobacteraceae bacterium]|nr:phage major capsid protein [Desulfobacteraceae bacterium]MBU4002693.1 phage major capsid protein [Pseudomonadota bacterium]MBU4055972.1 phage major capsid protein [Pseudomonadota bacterium]
MDVTIGQVLSQMDAVTNDYFMIDNGKAADLYFQTSFLLNYLLKQKKGLFKRPGGGRDIRVPFRYDGNESGFYRRGGTLSSDKRDAITAVFYRWIHAYGNGTIYRVDELENSGAAAMIDLVKEEAYGAQESITKTLAESLFDAPSGSTDRLTGIRAMCNENADLDFGNISENDVVAQDGTKPWAGYLNSTPAAISLDIIRDLKTAADYGNGKKEEPDLVVTTKTIFNKILSILQLQQRFTEKDSEPVKVGFVGVHFEGSDIFPDRFCPATFMAALNTNHYGFAVHQKGMFVRTPWEIIANSAQDKTFKILFDGNTICNNRRAQSARTGLTV